MNTYTSTRYGNVSENINDLVDELIQNENLLRWLTYLDDNPLSTNKPNVKRKGVIGDKIILTRINENILTKTEAKLFIYPRGGVEKRNMKNVMAETIFEANILLPNELGYIYPMRVDRFAAIASEIAKSLDGKNITGVGDVKVSTSFNTYKVNEIYTGMMFFINTTNSVMGKLDVDYGG